MTGKELIRYILDNNLENSNMFDHGELKGFCTIEEFAKNIGVGTEAVRSMIHLGVIKQPIELFGEIYIPHLDYLNLELTKGK